MSTTFTPGDEITWTQEARTGERTERRGQVWSLAPQCHRSSTAWVVPLDGGPAVAVTRVRRGGNVTTQTDQYFNGGETFAENAATSQTGALASAAAYHAANTRRDNLRRVGIAA